VKHLDGAEAQLAGWLAELRIEIDPRASATILEHLDWLLETNARMNLTAITNPAEALRLHVVDSLVPLKEVETAPEGALLDIGTGGGFPGLPLAIAAGRSAVVLDSVRKKSEAVAEFIARAGLQGQVSAVTARAEELALSRPGAFSVVTARAVAELPALVELAAPLLGDSGILVAMKARIDSSEASRGIEAAALVGLEHVRTRSVMLPGGGETRTVVTFRRARPSKVNLPRRVGLAQKRPLA